MTSFNYPQLSSSSRSIRLVKLLAASASAPATRFERTITDGQLTLQDINIRCELLLANLNDDPCMAYEAVSYYWGDPTQRTPFTAKINAWRREPVLPAEPQVSQRDLVCQILMDGRTFLVSPIVLDLLRKLHDPKKDRLLWIDFICIDQSNEDEKPRQVAIMREIFSRATCVVASLGPHYSYHTSVSPSQNLLVRMDAFSDGRQALGIVSSWAKTLYSRAIKSESDQRNILQLLGHPWFCRIWVVQEVAVARKLKLISGDAAINGADLAKFPELFMHSRSSPQLRRKMNELAPFFSYLQSASLDQTRAELLTLLQRFRSWNASEPVDKVYALLGLASDDIHAPELRIDYSIRETPDVLYQRVARYMIRRYKSLAVLTYSSESSMDQDSMTESPGFFSWIWDKIGAGQSTHSITPSWCPDWRHEYNLHIPPEPIAAQDPSRSLRSALSRYDDADSLGANGHSLTVFGFSVARVYDIYHNQGGVEVVLEPGFRELEEQSKWWPWRAASDHLSRLPKPLQKDDIICLLRGSTGLAILRPYGDQHRLVLLQHSQYALSSWTYAIGVQNPQPTLDAAESWMDDLCRLIARVFGTSGYLPATSPDPRSLLTDQRFRKMMPTPFVLV